MQRVMITGGPGSGKSTLARRLGASLDLPLYYMDQIHYLPHWQRRPLSEKIAMANAIEAKDAWIFEGGLSATYNNRAKRADTMIWLDLSFGLRIWRVIWRLLRDYGTTRPDMAPDCPEEISRETFAFWKWIWDTRHSEREELVQLIAHHPHLTVHHLTNKRAVDDFFAQFISTDL